VFELARLPNHISHEHRRGIKTANLLPIEFRNATFSYPSRPGRFVLHNLDLSIEENTCTAIVGASGSGKSTIASVLLGLYPMNSNPLFECGFSGSITLRGLDLSKIHIPTLRSLIAVVSQHPTLFSSTIRANISYGLDEHSPLNTAAAIINSARAAGIHDFITSLPLAYDTVVGDGGLGLSGGQAQRIAVARALIRQPQVLILDEATSNLDRESTEVIRKTVKDLMLTKMTIIIITHAMEMMEIADRVVVIDRGKVVDQGSFAELMHGGAGAILGHLATRPPTEQRVNVPAAT
jgi:ATP-binding cassette subfamily B (MDR/TAP) protein 1